MSLILDALRKADAERERGSVPSLHSHPVVPPSAEVPPKPTARPNWLWIAIGIAVGLVGAGVAGWVMIGRDAPPPTAVATPSPAQAGAPATPPAASTPPVSAVAPAPSSPAAPSAAIAEPAPWPQPDERKPARAETKGGAPAPVPVLGNVPLAEAQPQIYAREQLPPDVRAALPQLTIGGSIYSPNPAGRSLIVNGQLFRERDRLTQDLSLEEIRLKAAVFSFRGYRFEVLF